MKTIELTKGLVAMVDDSDFEELNKYKWHASFPRGGGNVYAVRLKGISMHRQILGLTDSKKFCDHIDRNGLNNQRNNLRIATPRQNQLNRCKRMGASSKFRGVYHTKDDTWNAAITENGKLIQLGCFCLEEDAARAYNIAAKELHGEFASLNNVDMTTVLIRNKKGWTKIK